MEVLSDTPLYKFNSNTLFEVRKELNIHNEGVLKQMIDNFEEWISKQNHFLKHHFDQRYLETSIVLGKGSLERAKSTLDKLCTLKTLLPHFFSKYDVKNELCDTSGFIFQATMPKLLKENYRVYIIKMVSSEFDSNKLLDFLRFTILQPFLRYNDSKSSKFWSVWQELQPHLVSGIGRHRLEYYSKENIKNWALHFTVIEMSEYAKCNDYSLGFVVIIDCRDVNLLNMVTKISIVDLHNYMSVLIDGYSMRIKGIHLLSSSKTIDTFVSLLKQIVSKKVADRIKVYPNVDALHEHISKDVLPEDFGGCEKPLKAIYENWVNVLSQKENVEFFKEIFKAGTNEKHRLVANYNDQILGMPGSFRTLSVD